MDAYRDRTDEALQKAAAPAYRKIRKDLEIPDLAAASRKLLDYLLGHLFDPDLNVSTWRRNVEVRDNSVTIQFRIQVGANLKDYLETLRLETAARMLAATDLSEHRIAVAVGYQVYRTFELRYQAWCGKKPTRDRGRPSSRIGPAFLQRAMRGELTRKEAGHLVAELRRLYPRASTETAPSEASDAAPVRVIDGREFERFQAEQVWKQIRTLPLEEQQRTVRTYLFCSTDLFDLLRRKSREEGRKDRRRGVDLARLALVSLDGHDEVFSQRIHDLRALGWAWLANARRLMLDFEGAEKDLMRCDDEWSVPRPERDLRISAEIYLLEAGLRTQQRRYREALEQVEEAIHLSTLAEDAMARAKALTLRASVMGYTDRLQESVSDLQLAATVIEPLNEPFLDFAIGLNQANLHLRLGEPQSASASLSKAKASCEQLRHRLGWYEIRSVEGMLHDLLGDVEAATKAYLEALDGFLRAEEPSMAVPVALELAILDLLHGRRKRAAELTRWSVPILQSMKLYEETLAAIELLACAAAAREIDRGTLSKVVRLLRLDPLVGLNQKTGAGRRISRPSCLRF